jgi:hypothetical protein
MNPEASGPSHAGSRGFSTSPSGTQAATEVASNQPETRIARAYQVLARDHPEGEAWGFSELIEGRVGFMGIAAPYGLPTRILLREPRASQAVRVPKSAPKRASPGLGKFACPGVPSGARTLALFGLRRASSFRQADRSSEVFHSTWMPSFFLKARYCALTL